MVKSNDIIQLFKKLEHGCSHTLTVDCGKFSNQLHFIILEKFEGVVLELKQEKEEAFSGFKPEFTRRDCKKGFVRRTVICWPVSIALRKEDKQ